jgi:hypothetical protein
VMAIIAARKPFMTAAPFKRFVSYAFIQSSLCLHSLLTQPELVIAMTAPGVAGG